MQNQADQKNVIVIEDVLVDLKNGLTRDEIAQKYDITKSECKMLFMEPELKGKKTIKKPSFTVVRRAEVKETEVAEDAVEVEQPTEAAEEVENKEDHSVVDETTGEVEVGTLAEASEAAPVATGSTWAKPQTVVEEVAEEKVFTPNAPKASWSE